MLELLMSGFSMGGGSAGSPHSWRSSLMRPCRGQGAGQRRASSSTYTYRHCSSSIQMPEAVLLNC